MDRAKAVCCCHRVSALRYVALDPVLIHPLDFLGRRRMDTQHVRHEDVANRMETTMMMTMIGSRVWYASISW